MLIGGANVYLAFAIVIHACNPLLLLMLAYSYLSGARDRGEPPHMGAGAA
jgi:hypothetical protein